MESFDQSLSRLTVNKSDHKSEQNLTDQMNEAKSPQLSSYQRLLDPYLYLFLTSPSPQGNIPSIQSQRVSPIAPLTPALNLSLPGYFKPLPQRLTTIDIDYLYTEGALILPAIPLRNALLQSYVEYVHPYMPLLELHEFLHIINEGNGMAGKISLLVFQAVMFSSVAFVNIDYLVGAGYTSRKAARKAFFKKVRVSDLFLLSMKVFATILQMQYDFDCEVDNISLIQCLLLMTYWHDVPNHEKDTWHWLGIAISLAYTIRLHENPKTCDPSQKENLRKRVW